MRTLVRDRLMAGDSDQEVIDYVVSSYGDFVLLNPPFKGSTVILWIGPLIFVLLALFAFYAFFRRQGSAFVLSKGLTPLTKEERNRLHELLKKAET